MILSIATVTLLFRLTYQQWTIIYDNFYQTPLTNDDVIEWNNLLPNRSPCPYPKLWVCDAGNYALDHLIIRSSCPYSEKTFTDLPPHYQVRLYVDAYFLGAKSTASHFFIHIDNVQVASRSYTTADLSQKTYKCSVKWSVGLDIKSYQINTNHNADSLTILFTSDVEGYFSSNAGKGVSMRNIQIAINKCHQTCKSCSGGSQYDCTTCYYGIPTGSGECNLCEINTKYIDVQQSLCVQECSRIQLANEFRVCQISSGISEFNSYFSTQFITSYEGWILLLDDVHYSIDAQSRSAICDSTEYLGPFYANEGLSLQLSLSTIVQQIRLRSTFFLDKWIDNTKISIQIDDVEIDSIYYISGTFYSNSDSIILITPSICTKIIRIELLMRTINPKTVLKIKGNMKNDIPSTWGIRDVSIDQIVCNSNCLTCASLTKCDNCNSGYFLHKGKCLLECPVYSIQVGTTCKDYDEESENARYQIKAFYDTTTQADEFPQIIGSVTSSSADNQYTGQQYGYLSGKRVYGGLWTLYNARAHLQITNLEPHFQIVYKMSLILGESIGNFDYTVTNLVTQTIFSTSPNTNQSNIIGTTNPELWFERSHLILHNSGTIDINLNYICQDPSFVKGFAAVANYFLIIHYCTPFCLTCTGPTKNDCTSWSYPIAQAEEIWSITSPPIVVEVKCILNYFIDTSILPPICSQCSNGCEQCLSQQQCTKCRDHFDLLNGLFCILKSKLPNLKLMLHIFHNFSQQTFADYILNDTICVCQFGYYNVGSDCQICHNQCYTCFGSNSNQCYGCYSSQNRILSHTSCVCEPYYEEVFENTNLICKPICGDLVLMHGEECDDGNNIQFDGCHQCKFQCPLNCQTCILGKCYSCLDGFILEDRTHKCIMKCGDLIVAGEEQCDSIRSNCINCHLQCQLECINCQEGSCIECKEGWYLNLFNNQCEPLCGDKILVQGEDCDDGNLIPYDGCFNCQYSCELNCKVCLYGQCQICRDDYYLEGTSCTSCCEIFHATYCLNYNSQCTKIAKYGILSSSFNQIIQFSDSCESYIDNACYNCLSGYMIDDLFQTCIPVCGDGITIGTEQCDDGNDIEFDGCYECRFSCQQSCSKCDYGVCYNCLDGWELVNSFCEPICGDGIIIANEQCDFVCQDSCIDCRYNDCFECLEGWMFEEYYCYPVCGDRIIVDGEDCDDGNDIANDGCFECKFSCEVNCDSCVNGECQQCKSGFVLDNSVASYSKCQAICGDQIVISEYEECDDGNLIEFDGCFNCQFSCHQACTNCLEGVCQECNTLGYRIDNDQCAPKCGDGIVIAPEQCDDQQSNCVDCQFQCHSKCIECSNGVCLKCEIGWYAKGDQCRSTCGDGIFVEDNEECDDGNNVDLDGCNSNCVVEDYYQCQNSQIEPSVCTYHQSPKMQLELISQTEDTANIRLTFNQDIKLLSSCGKLTNYLSYISVNLKSHENRDNEYEIMAIQQPSQTLSNVEFQITYYFSISYQNPVLVIEIQDNCLVSEYGKGLVSLQDSIKINDSQILSLSQRERAEQLSHHSEITIILIIIITLISLLLGNLDIFQNVLDQLQYLSYIQYINVPFPENLQIYFESFSLISLDPLMQYIKFDQLLILFQGNQDLIIEPQPKFAENGINAYFFDNIQSFLFCILNSYVFYFVCRIINARIQKIEDEKIAKIKAFYLKGLVFLHKQVNLIINEFYYFGLLEIFLANYYDISFATFIQVTNLHFVNIYYLISSICSIIFLVGQIAVTYKLLSETISLIQANYFYQSIQISRVNRISVDNNRLLVGISIKTLKFWSLQHNIMISLKKFLFIMSIVLLQQNGQIQSVIIALLSSFYLSYLLCCYPIQSQFVYAKIIVSELITIFNTLTFLIYLNSKHWNLPYESQVILGLIHILTFSFQLGFTFLLDVIVQLKNLFQKLKQNYLVQESGIIN